MNPFKYGILNRSYDLIRSYFIYRKTRRMIKDVFYGDDFRNVVHTYLNIELDEDWLGRLYGVINPNTDISGNFDVRNVIIEIDGNDTNTDEYVKTWLYKQLNLMGQLYHMKGLYSHVTMEIEKVGPVNSDNYLIVFDIAERESMADAFKKWLKTTCVYSVIAIITLCILFAQHII